MKNTGTAKFTKRDQAQSFLLIADLLQAGFSIKHALSFAGNTNPKLRYFFEQVDAQMKQGTSFANSLRPYVKPDLYYQFLIAEKHGDLVKTIQEIGKLMVSQEKQKKKLLALLQYPIILLLMLTGLVACLATFVFPELQTWQGSNGGMPEFIGYLTAVGTYFGTALIVTTGLRWRRWQRLSFEKKVAKKCHMPLIGKCYRYYYHYYLTSILGMMLRRGMSLKEICTLTCQFDEQSLLHLFGNTVIKKAQLGEEFSRTINQCPFLPDELTVFLNKGATAEKIGKDLGAFSEIQFKKLTAAIEQLLIYVQPVVFSLIAVIIVTLYLSILLPIYHSLQGVY